MKYKIRDRVLIKYNYGKEKAIISYISPSGSLRYKVTKLNKETVSGDLVTNWISGDLLEIDKQYYRDKKMNELGIK
jgi:hypothetical protein